MDRPVIRRRSNCVVFDDAPALWASLVTCARRLWLVERLRTRRASARALWYTLVLIEAFFG